MAAWGLPRELYAALRFPIEQSCTHSEAFWAHLGPLWDSPRSLIVVLIPTPWMTMRMSVWAPFPMFRSLVFPSEPLRVSDVICLDLGCGMVECRGLWRKWEEGFVRWHKEEERAKVEGEPPDPILSAPPRSSPIYVQNLTGARLYSKHFIILTNSIPAKTHWSRYYYFPCYTDKGIERTSNLVKVTQPVRSSLGLDPGSLASDATTLSLHILYFPWGLKSL